MIRPLKDKAVLAAGLVAEGDGVGGPTAKNPQSVELAELVETLSQTITRLEVKVDRLARHEASAHQRFFGVAEAARHAGLSAKSIRRLLEMGKLTAHRPLRGKILIDARELDGAILASTAVPRKGRGIKRQTGTPAGRDRQARLDPRENK